jgi:hypothetical protein
MSGQAAFERDDGTSNIPGQNSSWEEWVAASATHNFCRDDPILDWLEAFGESRGFRRDDQASGYDPRTDFHTFVRQKAAEFESLVTDYLGRRYKVIRIAQTPADIRSRACAEATWTAMHEGTEVIAQGVLWNPETQTYGAPDLLIRADILLALFPDALSKEETLAESHLPQNSRHYRVVDIKFTTIELLKDGQAASDLLKEMVEVWLYNEALGRLQGLTPPCAYLLGRRWRAGTKQRGTSVFERLARVNRERAFDNWDTTLPDTARAACAWVRRVSHEGAAWTIFPQPSVPELRPNPRQTNDQPWHQAKLQIVRDLSDLTMIPRVTPEKRAQAMAEGLSCWTDPGCTAARLGISGDRMEAIVDAVIRANHSPVDGRLVFPERIAANEPLWRTPAAAEFYVDFETVNDLDDDFSGFPEARGQPLIFMIGCGHLAGTEDTTHWEFRVFTAASLTLAEERRIIEEWFGHLQEVCAARDTPLEQSRLFHWSPAETSSLTEAYNAAIVRQGSPAWPKLPWVDLLNRVIKEQPVTVRGAFAFGLKAIAKAMHTHGLIQTLWSDGPADGLGAMVGAWWCHHEALRRGAPMTDIDLMREIERYNEVDCRVMAEVLTFLRDHR